MKHMLCRYKADVATHTLRSEQKKKGNSVGYDGQREDEKQKERKVGGNDCGLKNSQSE